jgi:tRNA modification GTPase
VSTDTIYALSSGRPPAAVSVIRISGPLAHEAGRRLAGELPRVRQASLRTLRDANAEPLDDSIVLRFDAPGSSTGEDIVELQCHGGRAITDAVLAELASIHGLRLALPGEFTRRAFENGRIDLTEAEGLADLIEAETESQRKSALAMAGGGLRRQVEQWQDWLIQLSARAEAAIDYVDDDDVAPDPAMAAECRDFATELSAWIERPRVEPLKSGVRIVVAGPPNAGKSSLINAIAGQERAIVTEIPGTTRDHLEVPLSLDGIPVLLTDTAGLRDSDDVVERIGIGRAHALVESADVLVWLGDPSNAPAHQRLIKVYPRSDQPNRTEAPPGTIAVSSATGAGIDSLLARASELAASLLPGEDALALNRRQAGQISEARDALQRAAISDDFVLTAENIRDARTAFDRLTGRAGMENVLDALFGRFCLGK